VPGAVAGWVDAVEHWGSGGFSIAKLLEPAAALAEDGFAVGPVTAHLWKQGESTLRNSKNCAEMLSPLSGDAPIAGEVFRRPGLARALRLIGREGKTGFYHGPVAEAIVKEVQEHGGLLALTDLAAHSSSFPSPISTNFHGVRLHEVPPNGQGITALLALNLLNEMVASGDFTPSAKNHNTADYLHAVIEAMRLAFADSRYYVSDSEGSGGTPASVYQNLLEPAYARDRLKQCFSKESANLSIKHGYPERSSCTVSFQVVDRWGNAVSMVNSNYCGFGTGYTPKGFGFTLQNRGHNFSLQKDHPNVVAGGKRPYHTIIPAMLTSASTGSLLASYTNMGAFMQPQGHVQLLLNMTKAGMDPQAAIDAPRFCIQDGTTNGLVCLEDGISPEIVDELRRRGHKVSLKTGYDRGVFGRAQIIAQDPGTRVLVGGSDGRGDGCASGW